MSGLGLAAGTVIGRDFKVERHLASGAMGSVYIVEQLSTGKQRALKVMSMELAQNERARERFVLEARVGSKIDSDHVVEVVSAGIDEATGAPYMVMELLQGQELADMIHQRGRLPLPEVAEILKQAGHALELAHQQGIVHRDIKPENLFIAESRREGVAFTVKILDFGIAKLVAERTAEGTQPVGTPLYMAPEQTDRRGIMSPAADVWPLGLIAFVLLTGTHYWEAADKGITQLLREVVMDPLVTASERANSKGVGQCLPRGFDDWFSKCVNRDPSQRYPTAGPATAAFEQLASGSSLAATAVQLPDIKTGTAPIGGTATGPLPMGGAVPAVTGDAHGTNMTAAATADISAASGGGKGGIIAAGVLGLVVLGGVGAYFATRDAGADAKPAASSAPPAATSAAPPPAPATCPDGMVKIESSPLFLGSRDADLPENTRPTHKVKLDSFCMDVTEVTVAMYEACWKSGNCEPPPKEAWFDGASKAQIAEHSERCNARTDRKDHPMNCVPWKFADNFCRTEGGRLEAGGAALPTEAQWEFAARGSSQRVYPWGDTPPGPKLLNACGSECAEKNMYAGDDGFAATAPVGSFPDGASSAGVMDLAGNVWEWTADWYAPYTDAEAENPTGPESGTERVVRGGGFNGEQPAWAKPAYRYKTDPRTSSDGIGFRCVAPFPKP